MRDHGEKTRILVVEDEKVVAETLGLILSNQGYAVRIEGSAEDAIESLAEWQPDVAILDVMLPKMNGIDLAIVLKMRYPNCHPLLFSGQPSVELLVEKAKSEGHEFEILAKPVHPSLMLTAISELLNSGCESCHGA